MICITRSSTHYISNTNESKLYNLNDPKFIMLFLFKFVDTFIILKIKHTLYSSCNVGCDINIILNNGEILETFPYKRYPINEGKHYLNGRNSIDIQITNLNRI